MNEEVRKMIGQKFIIGIDNNVPNETLKKLIQEYKIGGFILYKKNYSDYETMLKFIKNLKTLNKDNDIPLFISIDQEGGRVDRLPKEIKNTPPSYKLSQSENALENIKTSASLVNEALKSSGINMDFAPVLDIKRFPDNHAIGDRSFGTNKDEVIKYAIPYFKELNKGVVSVVKHFPGHGAILKDSHYFLPKVKSINCFNEDILSFYEAINNGCDAIMVGHILVKDINYFYPICFDNNYLEKEVREKFNYNGLFITDEIKMKGIYFRYNLMDLIKRAFKNGTDIILMKYTNDLNKFDKLYSLYINNKLDKTTLEKSFKRIVSIKKKYNINDNIDYEGMDVDSYNKKVEKLNSLL